MPHRREKSVAPTASISQTNDRITFEHLQPIRVKGRAELVRVYRPTGDNQLGNAMKTRNTRPSSAARMNSRSFETNLEAALAGESRILIIEGEAGIGKSRLVSELTRLIRDRGLTYLSGSGQSIEQQTPYRAWRDIFNFYFDIGTPSIPQYAGKVAQSSSRSPPNGSSTLPLLNDRAATWTCKRPI